MLTQIHCNIHQAFVQASFVDPTLLCSNLTLFSDVVAVDNNIIDTQLLQQTVCNLNINFTLLVEELQQHWDGFAELTDAVSKL